ncbi:MAG: cytidylate kinase-like family protein [Saprospiraceae bacterium]|nr:cytidylate kinase-like family protein [Saprospiraceae bacterium]
MSNIDRIISEQVLSWSQRQAKAKRNQKTEGEWPVITISREFGAMGRTLANEVGKRTGFKVWDKELLSAIAEEAGADERFLASLDEHRRKAIDDALYTSVMGSKLGNTHYFRSLLRVVHTLGAHGKCIIVGRGSNYIIKSRSALRVRIVCPREKRIFYIAERDNISEKDAGKLINARDAERNDFVRYYFKQDASSSHQYDLVLNSGVFNIDQLANLMLLAYEKKTGKAVPLAE